MSGIYVRNVDLRVIGNRSVRMAKDAKTVTCSMTLRHVITYMSLLIIDVTYFINIF